MPTDRERRIAENEAVFRVGNERMAAWEEQHSKSESELYLCECADLDCRDHLALTRSEYEHVRSRSDHFVVVPGHEIPDTEEVVEEHDGWVIVEKADEVSPIVEATDPRGDN